jgi:hypothetical protein
VSLCLYSKKSLYLPATGKYNRWQQVFVCLQQAVCGTCFTWSNGQSGGTQPSFEPVLSLFWLHLRGTLRTYCKTCFNTAESESVHVVDIRFEFGIFHLWQDGRPSKKHKVGSSNRKGKEKGKLAAEKPTRNVVIRLSPPNRKGKNKESKASAEKRTMIELTCANRRVR